MSKAVTADLRDERAQVVAYMHHQLVGPLGGASEELDGNPLDRYLLGVLYPQGADAIEVQKEEESEASPGAVEEETEVENPISMAFERLPASMGISFYVEKTDRVQCGVWGGVYRRVAKEKASERWKRESLGEPESPETLVINRPSPKEQGKLIPVFKGRASLHTVWRPLGSGFLVTVTLLNQNVAKEGRPNAEECLFQVGICCTGKGGVIADYPRLGALRHDSEEDELSLLYRDRRVYAVGHGCAAMWDGSDKNLTVRTAVMPVHEIFPVTRDLAEDKDEANKSTDKDVLSLERLADENIPIKSMCSELRGFVARYRRWIARMREDAKEVTATFADAAKRILDRLQTAADRMERGIKRLEDDKMIAHAFRLATRAMLMQMVHTGRDYGGTTRNRDERPFTEPAYSGASVRNLRWFPFQLAFQLLTRMALLRYRT